MRFEIEDNLINGSCKLIEVKSGRIVSNISGSIEFVNDYELECTHMILAFSYSHVTHRYFARWIFLADKRYTVESIENILIASASVVFI